MNEEERTMLHVVQGGRAGAGRGGCGATLNIAGQHYECDTECVDFNGNPVAGHDGWAHGNRDAQALWTCNQEDQP